MNQTQSVESGELKSDERLIAFFSHLSVFFGSIVVPLIFWIIYKDKSKFASFHSLQALFFHISYVVFVILIILILVFAGLGMGFLTEEDSISDGKKIPPVVIILMVILYGVIFLSLFVFFGYSIYIAVKSYQGELKKYPIIGKIVYKKIYGNI
ncbi:MAG: DUF4870 domain-containing protein [Ignavibacteria bacterium]